MANRTRIKRTTQSVSTATAVDPEPDDDIVADEVEGSETKTSPRYMKTVVLVVGRLLVVFFGYVIVMFTATELIPFFASYLIRLNNLTNQTPVMGTIAFWGAPLLFLVLVFLVLDWIVLRWLWLVIPRLVARATQGK